MSNQPNHYDDMLKRIRVIKFRDDAIDNNKFNELMDKIQNDVRYRQQFMLMLIERYHELQDRGFKLEEPPEVKEETEKFIEKHKVALKFKNA